MGIEDLRGHLNLQARQGDTPIRTLGIEIQQNLIELWGMIVLLGIQLYFTLHFRAFLRLQTAAETTGGGEAAADKSYPWIGLYRDALSRTFFQASLALSLAVCGYLAWYQHEATGDVPAVTYVFLGTAITLFLAAEWMLHSASFLRRALARETDSKS